MIKRTLGDVAMALGFIDDHTIYWKIQRFSHLITANLLGNISIFFYFRLIFGMDSIVFGNN